MLLAPGVHRLSFSVDTKPMSMYLLEGDQLILIDSGLPDTPESIYLPFISELRQQLSLPACGIPRHRRICSDAGGEESLRNTHP